MNARKNQETAFGRILATLLSVIMVVSVLVVPASANENSQEKSHDYLDWLEFDGEILKVEWEDYLAYPDWKIAPSPETFYRPIVYVPLGTLVSVKDPDNYAMTHDFTTPIDFISDPTRGLFGFVQESLDSFVQNSSYGSIEIFSEEPMKFGVYNWHDVAIHAGSHTISCEYTVRIAGVDMSTPAEQKSPVDASYPISGLEQYVAFSKPPIRTYTESVLDLDANFDNFDTPAYEDIIIYEVSDGTKLLLTDSAKQKGYDVSRLFGGIEDYSSDELVLHPLGPNYQCYHLASNSEPYDESLCVYIRPINQNRVSFTDVKANDYYHDAIQWAVKYGVTAGTSATTFSPGETCTTGQILTFLWRADGADKLAEYGEKKFGNIARNDYYYYAALWALNNHDMVNGANFAANIPCTRSMVATYLWKIAYQPEPTSTSRFADVPASAEYAQAVNWMVEQGITSGTSATTFSPNDICTRGQIATFIYRYYTTLNLD